MSDLPSVSVLPDFDPAVIVDLDVRDSIRGGHEPFPQILQAANALAPGAVLHLRAPFEPKPLFAVLNRLGFVHHSQQFDVEDWSSWFWRSDTPPVRAAMGEQESAMPDAEGAIDLRRLPPPEPLLVILDRVATGGRPFDVLLPFDPPPLHGFLAAQGWRAEVVEVGTDGVRMRIEPAGE